MTKSELKDIIKECLYENDIIEPIEEGLFGSNAKDHNKVKSDLKSKFKSFAKSTVKDRLTGKIKMHDQKTIHATEQFLESYFRCLGTQGNVMECTVNYSVDHYEKYYNAMSKSNSVYNLCINYMYDYVTINSINSSDTNIDPHIIKTIIETNEPGATLKFKDDYVKYGYNRAVINGYFSFTGTLKDERFKNKMISTLSSKGYDGRFDGNKLYISKK